MQLSHSSKLSLVRMHCPPALLNRTTVRARQHQACPARGRQAPSSAVRTPQASGSDSEPQQQHSQQHEQREPALLQQCQSQHKAGLSWLPTLAAPSRPQTIALGTAAAALALGLVTAHPAAAAALASLQSFAGDSSAFIPGLVGDDPLREGFVSALLLIFFSEIGDKTFFIALLLALQQPRGLVFTGTFSALAVMTVISVGLGRVLHQLDELLPQSPLPLDDLLAAALLIWFGISTLLDANSAEEAAAEEKEEAQEVVNAFGSGAAALTMAASTFSLVFAAEWGDKSFLATIALAAASSPVGVVLGAVVGHGLATALAVLGGSFLGRYIDERAAKLIGGSLFLVFAAATVFDIARGV